MLGLDGPALLTWTIRGHTLLGKGLWKHFGNNYSWMVDLTELFRGQITCYQ